jgi:hypothetical protein
MFRSVPIPLLVTRLGGAVVRFNDAAADFGAAAPPIQVPALLRLARTTLSQNA